MSCSAALANMEAEEQEEDTYETVYRCAITLRSARHRGSRRPHGEERAEGNKHAQREDHVCLFECE